METEDVNIGRCVLASIYDERCLDWPLAIEMAGRVGVSARRLSCILLRDTGRGYAAHIRTAKMCKAAVLLGTQPFLPIKQIAHILGYSQTGNFCRDFRVFHKITTREYRSQTPRVASAMSNSRSLIL
jgi:AraC-like DNA-binding protein